MYRVTLLDDAKNEFYYAYWYERPARWDLGRLCVQLVSTPERWWSYSSSTMIEVPDDV